VDIHDIRRRNLRLLVQEHAHGNLSQFVEVTLGFQSGRRDPTLTEIFQLSAALNVPPELPVAQTTSFLTKGQGRAPET